MRASRIRAAAAAALSASVMGVSSRQVRRGRAVTTAAR